MIFLRYVFDLSLQTGTFPDTLKIAKVTAEFKTDDLKEISNYRPISVLPCFSKILYIPQSMPLLNWLTKFMNYLKTTIRHLGFFIDLSKAFDTIYHAILLKKTLKIVELRVQILPASEVT